MADQVESPSFMRSRRFVGIVLVGAVLLAGAIAWFVLTQGRETTDDAQVDADMTTIAPRVGGVVLRVLVHDNQQVEAGAVLVELDPRDYQIAADKARADLADAEAAAAAAQSGVPITSTTASSSVTTAQGGVEQALGAVESAEREVDAAKARLVTAQARVREAEANATKSARDVERLRGLLAKDEVSQQQFDAATSAAEAQRAAGDSAKSQVAEVDAAIRVAESRLAQARTGVMQARASLQGAQTAPEQVAAIKAKAASAAAHVEQVKASLEQAELNVQYTTVKAPAAGTLSKKSANPGQVVQANQPLMALVHGTPAWVVANFKETQLNEMRQGQRAVVSVDAYGGRRFNGHVESISPATGARFSLLPPENATGNFVKVVQRVPVKIVIEQGQDPEHILRPGMSVGATVYTR